MRTVIGFICLISLLVMPKMAAAETVTKSSLDEQTAVNVTVYNSNLALVKDIRSVKLPAGEGELRFMDVASYIMPVTVRAQSLNYPKNFTVLEQNYEYDLMNSEKLLDKYVGKNIKIINWNEFKDTKETVEAVLLSNNQGQIYKINDEIYLGYPGYKVLPQIPENLIAEPTLMWRYKNSSNKPHKLEVSYLTSNINWKADYVTVLNHDDTASDLSGWVTVDNKSGATYKNAGLKLIAGEIHQVQDRYDREMRYKAEVLQDAPGVAQFQEKSFFEYHIYDLQRKTTIKDKQTKQISLLEASDIKTQKELLVYGIQSYFTRLYSEKIPKLPVNVYVKFKNSQANNLGMPLPAGIMRLYKKDSDGSLQFIGEDRIDHTPKDEEVRLKIGEAFDVVAERIQTDLKKISKYVYDSEWEITVRNHKEASVGIGLIEPFPAYAQWKIIDNNQPFTKVDAHTCRFDVTVPKDGEAKVKYKVRVWWE